MCYYKVTTHPCDTQTMKIDRKKQSFLLHIPAKPHKLFAVHVGVIMRAVAFALGIDVFHALFGNQDTFPCASGQHAVGGFGTVGIVGVYRTAVGSGLYEHVEHLVWIFYVGGARGACCIATMKKKEKES